MKKTLAFVTAVLSVFLSGCQSQPATKTDSYSSTTKTTTSSTNSSSTNQQDNMQTQAPQSGDTIVTIETSKGTIKLKLFTDLAPETTKNFMELAKAGKYDGVPFHRVIDNFMIQTGDFTNKNGTGGYSYKGPGTMIDNETTPKLTHIKGAVSMANAGPNTNGSQFFIVTADRSVAYLNGSYSVFGQVFEGQDVADAISKVDTTASDKPTTEILMNKVTVSTF